VAYGDRKSGRVRFERGIAVWIMGLDGTWRRDGVLLDVSQRGARLRVEGSLEGLNLKEFFLLLSPTGLVHRRCELVRVANDEIGIKFPEQGRYAKRKHSNKRSAEQVE
jgi:hypothetical protein